MAHRCIPCVDGCSPHWPCALNILAHLLVPLRKALVNYALTVGQNDARSATGPAVPCAAATVVASSPSAAAAAAGSGVEESRTLAALGRFFKELVQKSNNGNKTKKQDEDQEDDEDGTAETVNAEGICKVLEQQLKSMHLFRKEKEIKRNQSVGPAALSSKRLNSSRSLIIATIEETNDDGDGDVGCRDPLLATLLPKDATEALQLLLDIIYHCTRRALVRNSSTLHTWTALLDSAGLGILADVRTVGRRTVSGGDQNGKVLARESQNQNHQQPYILQRTKRETRILPCPLRLTGVYQSLMQGVEQYTVKRQLGRDEHKWGDEVLPGGTGISSRKLHAPSPAKPDFDFEVKIPLLDVPKPMNGSGNGKNSLSTSPPSDHWSTAQTIRFQQLPAFLFLGLQRFETGIPKSGICKPKQTNPRVEIPLELDLSKYCDKPAKGSSSPLVSTQFTLVGGILYDDGEYVAILKDPDAVAAVAMPAKEKPSAKAVVEGEKEDSKENDSDGSDSRSSDDSEDCTWKLVESDDVIPMTEADVLEFLAGDGSDDGVFGTTLVYATTHVASMERLTKLLSSLVLAGVSSGDRSMFSMHHGGGGNGGGKIPDLRSSLSEDVANYFYYEDDSGGSDVEYEYIEEEILSDEEY